MHLGSNNSKAKAGHLQLQLAELVRCISGLSVLATKFAAATLPHTLLQQVKGSPVPSREASMIL